MASETFLTIVYRLYLFTVDIGVFLVDTKYAKLIELLNVDLEKVSCWLNANVLAVNVEDTLCGVSPSQAARLSIEIQKNAVECFTRTKFLGVVTDNKLKWNDHIT